MNKELVLSSLGHTWFVDIDGTIFKHNGYKIDGYDTVLDGVKEFFDKIPNDDLIILVTSRTDEYKNITIKSLDDNHIRYNQIIFNAPYGERVLINDDKPSGLKMCKSVGLVRNVFCLDFKIDENI